MLGFVFFIVLLGAIMLNVIAPFLTPTKQKRCVFP
jgi:hypothetical protein